MITSDSFETLRYRPLGHDAEPGYRREIQDGEFTIVMEVEEDGGHVISYRVWCDETSAEKELCGLGHRDGHWNVWSWSLDRTHTIDAVYESMRRLLLMLESPDDLIE